MYFFEDVLLIVLLYICNGLIGITGLKNVDLIINPRVVRKGESADLKCIYDLEGAQLYTVKWYRGRHEFYRYTPSEHPSTKVFAFSGAHVDLDSSNEQQVTLRKVGFNLSGNFSCEVTTEAPSFSTIVVSQDMLVVVLPQEPPTLITERALYVAGDELRANCSTLPSRPPATISYFINNVTVCDKCEPINHTMEDLFWSELALDLPLFPSHFDHNGRLILRCVAQIQNLYQQDAELRLDNIKDPIPERVTSPNEATTTNPNILLATIVIYMSIPRIM